MFHFLGRLTPGRLAITALWSAVAMHVVANGAAAQSDSVSALAAAKAIEQALVDVIRRTEKSVVAIARVRPDRPAEILGLQGDRFGQFRGPLAPRNPTDPDFIPREFGTGVIIDPSGLILTLYHVVQDGDQHWVSTADRKTYPARIKAADPRSGLAILSIEASGLPVMAMGDTSKLRKGQIVVALGNPYAIARDGEVSASWGIIANLARKAGPIATTGGTKQKTTLHHFGTLIQTDARLNLGTSGGALINLDGQMVGLTTSIAAITGHETSAGYAIPLSSAVRRVIDVLKEGREFEYGLLGVEPENLRADFRRRGQYGSGIRRVSDGTPADWAGLSPNDVITHVDGEPIFDADGLMLHVGKHEADSTVKLTIRQGERVREVPVRLAKYPVVGHKVITQGPPSWRGLQIDYATALPVEEFNWYAGRGEIDLRGCIVIMSVEKDTPAFQSGLREKMFISQVAGKQIRSPKEFHAAVADQKGPVTIRLTVPDNERPVRSIDPVP